MVVQAASLIALAVTALHIDVWRFAGLRQAVAYLAGDPLPLPPEPFVQRGMYGIVRHPLYTFSILYIWSFPTMHAAQLAFAAGGTLYFVIGARFEEQRLLREIGPVYRAYRCRVPFLIPVVGLTASCADAPDLAGDRTR
jgi:protein-S-isoprenylcysteine O-methyltransferase Ste14